MKALRGILAAFICLGVGGCASVSAPMTAQDRAQNVSMVYRFKTVTEEELSQMVERLREGSLDMDSSDVSEIAACNATDSTALEMDVLYDDNQQVDYVRVASRALVVSQYEPSPPNIECQHPAGLPTINIQTSLALGAPATDTAGNATFRIGDVDYFADQRLYFKFSLLSHDISTGFSTGKFEFVARNRNDPHDMRVVIVRNGVFATYESE
jgi:hypothetical protein